MDLSQCQPTIFTLPGGLVPANVCDRCGRPVHQAAADADPQAARWYHDHIADDVFCGLVMHAADRLEK